MFYIKTQRLRLLPLTHAMLQKWTVDRRAMEIAIGLQPSEMLIDPLYRNEVDDALQHFWLPQTAEHPATYPWYTNWEIILEEKQLSIGGIGFVGEPCDEGIVEVGFMLDQQFQGRGYAQEALQGMINWALETPATKTVKARTMAGNWPCRTLLHRLGFQEVGMEAGIVEYRLEP
ncbi:RimJ/RimL family protein N-acetyltransferase [Chitinophaga skermanii]|uniref:RimJ/RimL family protein N-acetyltransferase n=1 Tax=Chitinophaga skermanii TaxID=331697 RepID=A0A327QXU7_9BACT|nr:GNAT family N-acetyltransferase [Chitinophaga skermanii]RAJ08462.1 RimJ/RimL family protein N-acetyltransferase [Chitinophaga skermanii]